MTSASGRGARMHQRAALALLAGTLAGATLLAGPAAQAADTSPSSGQVTTLDLDIPVGPEPSTTVAVNLDATVFFPDDGAKHPAVILAHGFGGSKADVAGQARDLAADGFVVMTYSARGFGASGGRIHLNDPAYEIKDASVLIDTLADRDDVVLDAAQDPRVGIVGASYGGALALMAAGADSRVDATVAAITWNDLADSLFGQSAMTSTTSASPAGGQRIADVGVFKQLWSSRFFGSAVAGGERSGATPVPAPATASATAPATAPTPTTAPTPSPTASTRMPTATPAAPNPLCGRFDPTVCALMMSAAETGSPSPDLIKLLRAHSPKPTLAKTTAPSLLIQGQTDTLFGLDQSDATARALAAAGTPVAIRWTDGGHDGRSTTQAHDEAATTTWLSHYLRLGTTRTSAIPVPAFTYALPVERRADEARLATLPAYPGLTSSAAPIATASIPLQPNASGGADRMLTPPGGEPASTTTVPGLGSLAAQLPTYQLSALPGQSLAFDTGPLASAHNVLGSPRVQFTVTSTGRDVTFFVSLWQVQGSTANLPHPLVAPVRVSGPPGTPITVNVALPAANYPMASGSQWRVLVTSTDSAYANPRAARADQIRLTQPTLTVPTATGTLIATAGTADNETRGLLIAIGVVLLALGAGVLWRRRQRQQLPVREDLLEVPLVVDGLVKTFKDGHRAVDNVSWRADKGQVVGLLGPNGAGKTTTMRMLLGLIAPDAGQVHILGQPVTAGSPVLGQIGALVEGPGFLPHLTGLENLHAYWRATGRPMSEAGFEEALDVAALGGALDRPVRTYSQGMRQRLGIAQAMLGRPTILFLDEPTNGLDPPQIAAMRPILQAYAATGRTVVVSSHLLAEVEQTCSHVVVMHAGKVITAGPVADLVASADTTLFEFAAGADPEPTAVALRDRPDVQRVEIDPRDNPPRMTVVSDLPRDELVRVAVEAGAQIVGVGSRRQLEEVFLGVIADAQNDDGSAGQGGTLVERLRQVRAR